MGPASAWPAECNVAEPAATVGPAGLPGVAGAQGDAASAPAESAPVPGFIATPLSDRPDRVPA
jgi:hypothetical protein